MADYSDSYDTFSTFDVFTDENREDISEEINRRWAPNYPLMSTLRKEAVSNPRFDIRRSNPVAVEYTVNSAVSSDTAGYTLSITLDTDTTSSLGGEVNSAVTSAYIPTGTLLMSKETMAVIQVTNEADAGSAVTAEVVSKGNGNQFNASDTMIKIGSAAAEFADIGTIVLPKMDRISNYTQITRTPIGISGTMLQSLQEYGSEIARQRREAAQMHQQKLEYGAWFSEKAPGSSGMANETTSETRTTRGIIRQIAGSSYLSTTNAEDIGGTLTEANFFSALKTAYTQTNQANQRKVLFGSATVMHAINNFARDRLQTNNPMRQAYGVDVQDIVTPFGSLGLVWEPWFSATGDNQGTFDLMDGLAVLIDLDDVEFVYLNGRNTQMLTGRQGNGEDGLKEEILTEWGIRLANPERHYVMYGITG